MAAEFTRVMRDSRHFHHPWVNAPCDMDAWRRYLERLERDNEAGFLVRRIADKALCGVINLNVITYEALCSAYISYYAVAGMSGRGYMKEGMQLVIAHAFGELGLHRLEANIQPNNENSVRLVESLGFECEGYSPQVPEDQRPLARPRTLGPARRLKSTCPSNAVASPLPCRPSSPGRHPHRDFAPPRAAAKHPAALGQRSSRWSLHRQPGSSAPPASAGPCQRNAPCRFSRRCRA